MGNKLFGFINRRTLDVPEKATKRIVKDVYLSWLYKSELDLILDSITMKSPTVIVEIGGAGGNTKILHPEIITTDVRSAEGIDLVMPGEKLAFENSSIDVIFGLDAFHHIRDPEIHLREVSRTLRNGGNLILIEPNWNRFSKFCFQFLLKYLHPEPYNTKQNSWTLSDPDPMMGNQCQAYNIFVRDREKFNMKFPELKVEFLEPLKGISFLISGGVHTRLPIPSRILIYLAKAENLSNTWLKFFGLGRLIRITKVV